MSETGGANEDRPRTTIDETALAHQVHEAWEKAAFWDKMMGEGNAFQRVLIGPATERLLRVLPRDGARRRLRQRCLLEEACGTRGEGGSNGLQRKVPRVGQGPYRGSGVRRRRGVPGSRRDR